MRRARPALLVAALAALALLRGPPAARAGPVVRCAPCDARARSRCAPPPAAPPCAELVREPGCGCCVACALPAGRPCGVYTARCGAGLRCRPEPGEARPLQALLGGRGLCAHATRPAPAAPGNGSESEEDLRAGGPGGQAQPSTHRTPDAKFAPGHSKMDVIKKGHARDSQRYKVDDGAQSVDTQNVSSESKQDAEYGPCRREMEDTLNRLKFLNMLSPRDVHIPNCDKKGFYKKKQCRPSNGRKRGSCWCVDRYGQPLPRHGAEGKGDAHCYGAHGR